ncbi:MAG: CopG family ribbon-helix-helix protein [Methylobacterium sp.]|nr:CopG family ribbon-helix-helix protein [Methylobacterium sp.]MCA3604311.1 CopG family ribbon-helix-helix protein [Methylobacterium sp.]MCA3616344.1 CopG family ribbon-helix-helix protein [Methylobacterium sp.]MCA4909423.1 CopG family ribbon-helix-helix protein [Methylobacterium sp.]
MTSALACATLRAFTFGGVFLSASVTIRLDDEAKLEALDKLAQSMDRSRNWIVNRAIERFIAEQAWQIEKIERGIAEANRGEFASPEEVQAAFARFGAKARAAE